MSECNQGLILPSEIKDGSGRQLSRVLGYSTQLASIEDRRWRSPLCTVSLGSQVLSPGLGFPICEMKPWICVSSEALLAQMLCGRTNGERVRVEKPILTCWSCARGGGPTGAWVPIVPRNWSLQERVAAGTRRAGAKAPGIVLTELFLLPSFSPYPRPSRGTAEPSKK